MKLIKQITAISLVLGLVSGTSIAGEWPSELVQDMDKAARAIADNWIDDRNPEQQAWAWGEGVLAYGLVKTADATGDAAYLDWLNSYIDHHDQAGKEMQWSDHLSPAISALYISRYMDPDREIKSIANDVVDYIMSSPRSKYDGMLVHLGYRAQQFPYFIPGYPEAWVDSLFHITPTLALYSDLTGDDGYLEEAVAQVDIIVSNLQDPNTGLVAHAKFDNDNKSHEVPRWQNNEFWARGNGWALVSLVELLSAMPETHPKYASLLDRTRRLEAKLRAEQGRDGRYHTLVTKTSTYYETAATALILYAMAKGYEAGFFGDATRNAVVKGSNGLLNKTLRWNRSGSQATVRYTSIGTNPDPGLYRWVPRKSQVNYGVGAWLMLAAELID